MQKYVSSYMLGIVVILFSACNGIMDSVYDNGKETYNPNDTISTIYVDANSWTDWFYIDLHALRSRPKGSHDTIKVAWPIPLARNQQFNESKSGIYTYWYDVENSGLSNHEFRSSYPTDSQPEPQDWDIAVHRDNVRTNGGAVFATSLYDIRDLSAFETYANETFTEDEWSETDVWCVNTEMIAGVIGNQGIKINKVMSEWLTLEIPPFPPSFSYKGNVFILRMKDGSHIALRLRNYLSKTNKTCCLTIEYR